MSADLDISVVEQSLDVTLATLSVEVEASGPRGPQGIQGAAGVTNLFVSASAPSSPPAQYLWVQLLGGGNYTLFVEDGA